MVWVDGAASLFQLRTPLAGKLGQSGAATAGKSGQKCCLRLWQGPADCVGRGEGLEVHSSPAFEPGYLSSGPVL